MPAAPKASKSLGQSMPARFFHVGAAAALMLVMLLGFQQFYLPGRAHPDRPLAPPIRTLIISHGVAMSDWVLLLLVQALLIVNRQRRIHMMVGEIGAVLAACMSVLGFRLGIEVVKVSQPEVRPWNLPYRQFMAVPIMSIAIFAGFVAAGIWYRRRPEVHRSMMLLATLTVISAAADRIGPLGDPYRHTIWRTIFGPFFSTLVLGAVFLVAKWALTRSFDRYYAMGWAGLVVASAAIMQLAPTSAWDHIASFLLS
jgi:hypothetical protein